MQANLEYGQMREMVQSYQHRLAQDPASGEQPVAMEATNGKKKESHAEAELRRDLKKARHQLKQYEGRIKSIEEEHKQVTTTTE